MRKVCIHVSTKPTFRGTAISMPCLKKLYASSLQANLSMRESTLRISEKVAITHV
jgi:hypothetical protein